MIKYFIQKSPTQRPKPENTHYLQETEFHTLDGIRNCIPNKRTVAVPRLSWGRQSKSMFVCFWHDSPQWAMASSFTRFLDHTQRCTTVGRTPLDEWSARRRDLYLTTHNIHDRQTSMTPVGFEPTMSVGGRPQTCTLDRAPTGTDKVNLYLINPLALELDI